MSNTLKQLILQLYESTVENKTLRILDKNFSNESISDTILQISNFQDVNLIDFHFQNVNFACSFFTRCSFKNCVFERTQFSDTQFFSCNFENCCLKDCNLIESEFSETTFNNCQFENNGKASLTGAWFDECHFIEISFNNFDASSLFPAAIVDSKFSKFDQSIEFKGEFYLLDILQSNNGIEKMFCE